MNSQPNWKIIAEMFIWWIIGLNSNWHFLIWLNIEWERSVSISNNISVFGADFRQAKVTTGAIFWVDPRLFPELLREMVLCYFSRCCYYLGLSLSSYYERYIQSFRLCRRFRFARLFRSFRKWPRRNGVNLLVKASRLVAMLRISTNLQFMFIENGWG
jgi:hypothetical protein